MAKLDFSSMASLFKKPLSEVEQIAGLLKQYNPLSRNNQAQLGMDKVLSRGANVNGDKLDFKTQTEELIENAPIGTPAPSFGNRVLGSFLDYAKSPAGMQALGDLAQSIIASGQSNPYTKDIMAKQVQKQIAQRPILEQQRLDREKKEETEKLNLEDKYRVELANKKTIKDTEAINSAVSRITNVWESYLKSTNVNSKNALDQALIISFNKMLDPGSVVRESEFARTPKGQALDAKLEGWRQKLLKGGVGLTDENREEILLIASQLQAGQIEYANKIFDKYEKLANRRGLTRENIFTRYNVSPFIPSVGIEVEDQTVTETVKVEGAPKTTTNRLGLEGF